MGNYSTLMEGAERLLAMLPGVRSASIEGDVDRATDVRLLVEEDPPLSEIMEAVRAALDRDIAEFPFGTVFHVQVASSSDGSRDLQSKTSADPLATSATASPASHRNGSISLVAHQVRDLSPGVTGVELTLGLEGHSFAGGASGKADSSSSKLVPALATLSALGSYVRFASNGAGPTLALESVSEVSLGDSRVAVVVVTMSGHAGPLIASWPLTDAPGPAVVRATLEATARRITRLSSTGDRQPKEATEPTGPDSAKPTEPDSTQPAEATELAESTESTSPTRVGGSSGMLRQQAESLLESAEPIASARIGLDNEQGFRIHVLATASPPKAEILQMVVDLLQEELGLRVRLDQITVAQSRLSREELDRILHPTSPSASADASTPADAPAPYVSRPTLVDFHIVAQVGGKQEVRVRIEGGGGSFDGRREADGEGVALLRPLAEATLDAIGELMRRGGREVVLVLKDVRRFRRRDDDGVVVLVEAVVDGRKTMSSGVAFSDNSFDRASVVAVLQATNAFVDGVPEVQQGDEEPSDSPEPSDGPESTDSLGGLDSPGAPASPSKSAPPKSSRKSSSPYDYVSEVLSRMQPSTRAGRAGRRLALLHPD